MTTLHYFTTDNVVFVTPNKVASRFMQTYSNVNLLDEAELIISDELKIIPNSIHVPKNQKIDIDFVYNEFNSILDNTIKNKKVIFLYRSPLNRTYSGFVQNFLDYSFGKGGLLKIANVLSIKPDNIYLKSLIQKETSNSNTHPWYYEYNDIHDVLNDNELDLLGNFLIKFISLTKDSDILSTGHTREYLEIYYNILSKYNLNTSNIHLIDIDVETNLLEQTITSLLNTNIIKAIKTSNKFFVDVLKNKKDIHNRVHRLLENELFYYEKIKKHPFNLKEKYSE